MTFGIYPSSLLKYDFTDVKILGITTYDNPLGGNLAEQHTLVFPTLPPDTPNDYRAYNYLTVRMQNNDVVLVGLPWIKGETVQFKQTQTLLIQIDGVGPQDVEIVNRVLAANGYTAAHVKLSAI